MTQPVIPPAPDTTPNVTDKPRPIPREEPDPVMMALQRIMDTQAVHGTRMDTIVESQTDIVTRVTRLEEKAPGSNPPPRTASGFTAAVRQISQTTESEPDKATAAQVKDLSARLERIETKTDAQTELLHTIVTGVGEFAKQPTVQRIAKVAGYIILGVLMTYAATHGIQIK